GEGAARAGLPLHRRAGRSTVVTRIAGPAVSSAENNVLCGLYQQVTDQQGSSLGAGYDLTAGLTRYRAWLGRQATLGPDQSADQAVQVLFGQHYRSLGRVPSLLLRAARVGPGP